MERERSGSIRALLGVMPDGFMDAAGNTGGDGTVSAEERRGMCR